MDGTLRPRSLSQRSCRLGACLLVAGMLPSIVTGCVTLDSMSGCWHDAPPCGEVAQVMTLWAGGIVVQPDPLRGGIPSPGVAGRIYLFGAELGTPLRADGSLIVHLYDDSTPESGPKVPREVWTVDAANLQRVQKKDGLGWGYNLWLPWSTYEPSIQRVHLVVCYKPVKGSDAWSSSTTLQVGGSDSSLATAPRVQSRTNSEGAPTSAAEVTGQPVTRKTANAAVPQPVATVSLPVRSAPRTPQVRVGP